MDTIELQEIQTLHYQIYFAILFLEQKLELISLDN